MLKKITRPKIHSTCIEECHVFQYISRNMFICISYELIEGFTNLYLSDNIQWYSSWRHWQEHHLHLYAIPTVPWTCIIRLCLKYADKLNDIYINASITHSELYWGAQLPYSSRAIVGHLGDLCQSQVSKTRKSNYTAKYMCAVINHTCHWCLLLVTSPHLWRLLSQTFIIWTNDVQSIDTYMRHLVAMS